MSKYGADGVVAPGRLQPKSTESEHELLLAQYVAPQGPPTRNDARSAGKYTGAAEEQAQKYLPRAEEVLAPTSAAGVRLEQHADGSHTVHVQRPGAKDISVDIPKGFQISTETDGTIKSFWPYNPAGHYVSGKPHESGNLSIEVRPDGSVCTKKAGTFDEITRYPDGRFHYETFNWNSVDLSAESTNGRTLEIKNPHRWPETVKVDIPPHSKVTVQDDGSVSIVEPDGTKVTASKDGTVRREKGTVVSVRSHDGTTVTQDSKDGSKITENPNGPKVTIKADGTRIKELQSGETITKKPDGTETRETAADKMIIHPATSTAQAFVEIYDKKLGTTTRKYADGTEDCVQPNGITTTKLKDGTELKSIPYADGGVRYESKTKEGEFKTHDSPEALAKAKALQGKLEKQFGVSFSDGTEAPATYSTESRPTRKPTLQELRVIESALLRSQPANKGGLKFTFLEGKPLAEAAAYENNGIFIAPSALDVPSFHKDANDKILVGSTRGISSLEEGVLHELAHWADKRHELTGLVSRVQEMGHLYGFHEVKDKTGARICWLIEGKNPNEYYRHNDKGWERCDRNGKPDGTPAQTDQQVRELARVRPASQYFDTPWETSAEAKHCLYMGGEHRRALARECPRTYAIAKREDQGEIESAYGAGYIRGADGYVVAKTQANIAAVEAMERQTPATTGK